MVTRNLILRKFKMPTIKKLPWREKHLVPVTDYGMVVLGASMDRDGADDLELRIVDAISTTPCSF